MSPLAVSVVSPRWITSHQVWQLRARVGQEGSRFTCLFSREAVAGSQAPPAAASRAARPLQEECYG